MNINRFMEILKNKCPAGYLVDVINAGPDSIDRIIVKNGGHSNSIRVGHLPLNIDVSDSAYERIIDGLIDPLKERKKGEK